MQYTKTLVGLNIIIISALLFAFFAPAHAGGNPDAIEPATCYCPCAETAEAPQAEVPASQPNLLGDDYYDKLPPLPVGVPTMTVHPLDHPGIYKTKAPTIDREVIEYSGNTPYLTVINKREGSAHAAWSQTSEKYTIYHQHGGRTFSRITPHEHELFTRLPSRTWVKVWVSTYPEGKKSNVVEFWAK